MAWAHRRLVQLRNLVDGAGHLHAPAAAAVGVGRDRQAVPSANATTSSAPLTGSVPGTGAPGARAAMTGRDLCRPGRDRPASPDQMASINAWKRSRHFPPGSRVDGVNPDSGCRVEDLMKSRGDSPGPPLQQRQPNMRGLGVGHWRTPPRWAGRASRAAARRRRDPPRLATRTLEIRAIRAGVTSHCASCRADSSSLRDFLTSLVGKFKRRR